MVNVSVSENGNDPSFRYQNGGNPIPSLNPRVLPPIGQPNSSPSPTVGQCYSKGIANLDIGFRPNDGNHC
jgi:hypothetical protein